MRYGVEILGVVDSLLPPSYGHGLNVSETRAREAPRTKCSSHNRDEYAYPYLTLYTTLVHQGKGTQYPR